MTREEAGQRILEGNYMVPCKECDRCGAKGSTTRPSQGTLSWSLCLTCGYDGLVLDPSYEEACRVLEMPIPINPEALPQKVMEDMLEDRRRAARRRAAREVLDKSVLPTDSQKLIVYPKLSG